MVKFVQSRWMDEDVEQRATRTGVIATLCAPHRVLLRHVAGPTDAETP